MVMSDPSPAYCFTIPSICDSTPLDCRIYHPPSLEENRDDVRDVFFPSKKAAIVAHPYAPLGGSFDDPVVMTVVEQLLDLDFIVGTFNFRGAHNSKGSTSWTGKAEREDYVSVIGYMIFYIDHIKPPEKPPTPEHSPDLKIESSKTISLVLGGYSYGSLILTQLPPVTEILQQLHTTQHGSPTREILLRAKTLANQTNENFLDVYEPRGRKTEATGNQGRGHASLNSRHSIVYGGNETPSPPTADHRPCSREIIRKSVELPRRIKHAIRHGSGTLTLATRALSAESQTTSISGKETLGRVLPHVAVSYLLISPLLPPLSSLLSLSMLGAAFRREGAVTETLGRENTMVVFGSEDGFTAASRLRAWCRKMRASSVEGVGVGGRFRWVEVEDGGHFWRERGVAGRLKEVLESWVGVVVTEGSVEAGSR